MPGKAHHLMLAISLAMEDLMWDKRDNQNDVFLRYCAVSHEFELGDGLGDVCLWSDYQFCILPAGQGLLATSAYHFHCVTDDEGCRRPLPVCPMKPDPTLLYYNWGAAHNPWSHFHQSQVGESLD